MTLKTWIVNFTVLETDEKNKIIADIANLMSQLFVHTKTKHWKDYCLKKSKLKKMKLYYHEEQLVAFSYLAVFHMDIDDIKYSVFRAAMGWACKLNCVTAPI